MNVLLDTRYIQKLSLCAFIHKELARAELNSLNGAGKVILEEQEQKEVREVLLRLLNYFHKNGLIMKNAMVMSRKSKRVNESLSKIQNSISKVIEENSSSFNLDSEKKLHWIPSLFALTILKKLDNLGLRYFPEDIDLQKTISLIENTNKVERNELRVYWKMARNILESLKIMEK